MADHKRGGAYLGRLPSDHPYADPLSPATAAVDPSAYKMTPEQYMETQDENTEGYMLPGSNLLWLKPKPQLDPMVPMSYLDPETANG